MEKVRKYSALTVEEIEEQPLIQDHTTQRDYRFTLLNYTVFLISFCFYYYCIFMALSPLSMHSSYEYKHRRLDEESNQSIEKCNLTNVALGASLGSVLGAAALGGTLLLIGLSPAGPIAGGLFAANMGAGLAAGSAMSVLQAAAMTGTSYATAAALGGVVGASSTIDYECIPK